MHEHLQQLSAWKCFLLARWCIRHCLYKIAVDLLKMLNECVHVSIHRVWLDTLMDMCRAEERLQIAMSLFTNESMDDSSDHSARLCENLAEAGSFYESSLIQMPVTTDPIDGQKGE